MRTFFGYLTCFSGVWIMLILYITGKTLLALEKVNVHLPLTSELFSDFSRIYSDSIKVFEKERKDSNISSFFSASSLMFQGVILSFIFIVIKINS